jgi:hypothetical protein
VTEDPEKITSPLDGLLHTGDVSAATSRFCTQERKQMEMFQADLSVDPVVGLMAKRPEARICKLTTSLSYMYLKLQGLAILHSNCLKTL